MQEFNPQEKVQIGELYMSLAFLEMQLGEDLCNGTPLGLARNGVVDYSDPSYKPLTNQEVFAKALTHADSAVSLSAGDSTSAVLIRNAALVTKARILVDMGQWAQAAALVPSSTVPSTFQYVQGFSVATTDNGNWSFNNSQGRYTVGDSTDIVNGAKNTIKNALPFVSAADPRVPTRAGTSFTPNVKPFDTSTPLFLQQIWVGRSDPIPVVSGIDARLIEAEAKLQAKDIAGMMTILNALRAAPPAIGSFKPTAMAALAAPATQVDATTLFFREKAFWTFGRGQRLGDLRRLIRQYGRTQADVFPTGNFHKGGVQYLNDVNLPVTDTDKTNPQFKGCLDRNA
jgi:starch-binding outer membrane protein, SusD/RagB family